MTATSGRNSEDERIFEAFSRFATDCLAIVKGTSGPLRKRITASKDRLRTLASYEGLLQILLADPRACAHVRKIVFRGDGGPLSDDDLKKYFENDVLLKLLDNYISQLGGVEFDAARFADVYSTVEASIAQ